MLDDLYAMSPAQTDTLTEAERPPRAPSWSSEEALDEVFASWVPGPGADSSAAERSMVAGVAGEVVSFTPTSTVDEWLLETEPVAEAVAASVPARWSPSDDDILPARRGRGRRDRRRH